MVEPRVFLTTQEAAFYLGIGWRQLRRMRVAGKGPRFRRHGRLIFYHTDELDAWSRESIEGGAP